MYSFSSFFSSFMNFGQAKTDIQDAKAEAKKESSSYKQDESFLANRNHGGPGTGDKFGRYGEGEYENLVTQGGKKEYTNSFVTRDRTPSSTRQYTNSIIGRPLNHSNTRAYKRAYAGYKTNSIFSTGVSRLSSLTGLFNSQINDPFGYSNSYGGNSWA